MPEKKCDVHRIGMYRTFLGINRLLGLNNRTGHFKSSRRLTISWLADLSHHRAYGSVHGGSLVFTNYQIIVKYGRIS